MTSEYPEWRDESCVVLNCGLEITRLENDIDLEERIELYNRVVHSSLSYYTFSGL